MVEFHVQNAVLGEPTEDGLIRFWSHMGLMSDTRASSNMVPDEVWQEMPSDPEIEDLERRRAELKGSQFQIQGCENEKEIRDIGQKIRYKKGRRNKNVRTGYRKYYFRNRPTWDIERQFSGDAEAEEEEAEEEYVAPVIELHIPERAELITTAHAWRWLLPSSPGRRKGTPYLTLTASVGSQLLDLTRFSLNHPISSFLANMPRFLSLRAYFLLPTPGWPVRAHLVSHSLAPGRQAIPEQAAPIGIFLETAGSKQTPSISFPIVRSPGAKSRKVRPGE